MSLVGLLDAIEDSRLLWIARDKQYSVEQIRDLVLQARNRTHVQPGQKVVLEIPDTVEALVWMLALDGIAASVLLMPVTLQRSDVGEQLKEQFRPDFTFTELSVSDACPAQGAPSSASDAVDTQWVLASSGTTGLPKLVAHTFASLTRSCKMGVAPDGEHTWAQVFDPFRFAGLQVVLQSLASGSRLVFCHESPDLSDQARLMREWSVNALSATPSYWRKLLFSGFLDQYSLRQITLGGEPADQSILNALRKAFPDARIRHIYASTEAGVGFSVTDGLAGFPVAFLEQGVGDTRLAIGPDGTLLLKSGSQHPSILGNEELDDDYGFIDSGDLVEVRGDRVFFLGRQSGAINVGGDKVIPEEVESVIRSVEGVAETRVQPVASSVIGQLVMAIVQPTDSVDDTRALKARITAHCRENLDKYKVPVLIRFVDQIAQTSTGKISRK